MAWPLVEDLFVAASPILEEYEICPWLKKICCVKCSNGTITFLDYKLLKRIIKLKLCMRSEPVFLFRWIRIRSNSTMIWGDVFNPKKTLWSSFNYHIILYLFLLYFPRVKTLQLHNDRFMFMCKEPCMQSSINSASWQVYVYVHAAVHAVQHKFGIRTGLCWCACSRAYSPA